MGRERGRPVRIFLHSRSKNADEGVRVPNNRALVELRHLMTY